MRFRNNRIEHLGHNDWKLISFAANFDRYPEKGANCEIVIARFRADRKEHWAKVVMGLKTKTARAIARKFL